MKAKRNNIVIALSSVLALIAAVGTTSPVFAHTDKYNIGYSQGQEKATEDYNNYYDGHNYYRPFCPTNDAWTRATGRTAPTSAPVSLTAITHNGQA